jgi:hypothetical protein
VKAHPYDILLRAAVDVEVRGNIAMTRLHYLEAARYFQEAADLVPAGHPDDKGRFLFAKAGALLRHGDEHGDNAALMKAIATYQLASQEFTRDLVQRADAAIKSGQLEEADQLVRQAQQAELAAAHQAQQLAQHAQAAADQRSIRRVSAGSPRRGRAGHDRRASCSGSGGRPRTVDSMMVLRARRGGTSSK